MPTADRQLPRALVTPRAAAVAGVAFALLFGMVLSLVHLSLPQGVGNDAQEWVDPGSGLRLAIVLMPFAGIAYLWFVAVVRDGFGRVEDRFYSTVFLASSLLFLAMMFVSVAAAAGMGNVHAEPIDPAARTAVLELGSGFVLVAGQTFAVRMAAVAMISLATIWLKSGIMPRWLAIVSYVSAVVLLAASDLSVWVSMVYPAWALVISLSMLWRAGVDRPDDGSRGVVRGD